MDGHRKKLSGAGYLICSVVLSAYVLCSSVGYGQSLGGRVFNGLSRRGLHGACVTVRTCDSIYEVYSDAEGGFRLEHLAMGRASVTVTHDGYRPWEASSVVLLAGHDAFLMVGMQEREIAIAEVAVGAPSGGYTHVGIRQLTSEEANRYAGSWGDAARMVTNTAGVFSASDMRNDIVVRGNSPVGVVWLIDGFELPNPNHFGSLGGTGGPVSILNSNQLASSVFYTGGFPAEYGNVTSGLFDLRLQNGNTNRHEFMLGMGFNGLEGGAQGPLGKKGSASYMVNARYSFLKLLKLIGILKNVSGVPRYHDVTAKVNIPLKHGSLSWIGLWGWSALRSEQEQQKEKDYVAGAQVFNMRIDDVNKQFFTGLNYTHSFTDGVRMENRLSYQIFSRSVGVAFSGYPHDTVGVIYAGHEREDQLSYKAALRWEVNRYNTLRLGAGGTAFRTVLDNVGGRDVVLQRENVYSGLVRAYVQWQHRFEVPVGVNVGIYSQCYTLNGDYAVEPRASLRWEISNGTTFGLGTGMYSMLLPRQVYFFQNGNTLPNRNLGATRSWQVILSLSQRLVGALSARLETYYIGHYDVPVPRDVPQESFLNVGDDYYNAWDREFFNRGLGRNYGVELTLERPFRDGYYYTLTGTWYRAQYRGADGEWRLGKFSGDFGATAVAGYEWRIGQSVLLGVNGRCAYIGGKRYTPSRQLPSGGVSVEYARAYSQRYPNYFRLDLNVSVKQSFAKWSIESFVEVTNVTNQRNVNAIFYDEAYGKERRLYENSIMPMGGVRVNF